MRAKIKELTDYCNYHDRLYRVVNKPEITDPEYDKAYNELLRLEGMYPQFVCENSPTKRIGYTPENGIAHMSKMYSISNIFEAPELLDWLNKSLKLTGETKVYADIKADGLAIRLSYKDGYLMQAATRGDGVIGDSVLHHMHNITTIPKVSKILIDHEIYGELVICKPEFIELNKYQKENNLPVYKTPRSAVSGISNTLQSPHTSKLKFLAYGSNLKGYSSYSSMMQSLNTECKFLILDHVKCRVHDIATVIKFYNTHNLTTELFHWVNDIPTDGVVIKVDSLNLQASLGYTEKYPRFCKAWKYRDVASTTEIEDIVFQIGRTGVITYVAKVKPVEVDGVIIKQANLYNESTILTKKLFIGNIVAIIRRGGVIPYITHVVSTTPRTKIYKPITHCPFCNSSLAKTNSGIKFCNNISCTGIQLSRFSYFSGKSGLDIQGCGGKVCEKLISSLNFKHLGDLLKVSRESLVEILGEKIGETLYIEIQKVISNLTLQKIIDAIGIARLSSKDAVLWVNAVKDSSKPVDELINLGKSVPHLKNIGLSNISMDGIMSYLYVAETELREICEFLNR